MMRFQAAITSGLAAILVPAVYLGQGSIETLEQTLAQTTRALEVLAGIEQSSVTGDPQAVRLVRSVTEPPILDDRRRDERLVELRHQVNLLQSEVDVLETPSFVPEAPAEDPALPSGEQPLPMITTGLSAEALQALSEQPNTATSEVLQAETPVEAPQGSAGYSADPTAHARACYYARRYEQCVALTQDLVDDPDALFWRSRALEKLGKLDEAIEAMKRSAELGGESPAGQRAQAEVDFLEWRRSFLSDAPHRAGGKQS